MSKAAPTPFDNVSDGAIADEWGRIAARQDKDDARLEALKKEFNRRGLRLAQGEKFIVLKKVEVGTRINTAAIRAEMGEAWCSERSKSSSRTSFVVTPVAAPEGANA
jgi:hypothetical protein